MTNSTTANGWMNKSNFNKYSNNPIQVTTRIDASRHYAQLFMDADVKGYSQWFTGKQNNIVDALSQDWHRNDGELASIPCFHSPKQMPKYFKISPLPNEISSWLTSLLQQLPVREQLRELHMTTKLDLGEMGNILPVHWMQQLLHGWTQIRVENSHAQGFCHGCQIWTILRETLWDTGWGNSQGYHLTCGTGLPGWRADRTQQRIEFMNIASFYQDSSEPFKMKIPSKPSKKPYHFQSLTN